MNNIHHNIYTWDIAVISFTIVLYLLALLSKRLGSALQFKPYFYIYYLGIIFMLIAEVYSSLVIYTEKVEMIANFFLAIGMTLGLVATIKYWGWLVKELK